DNLEHRKLQYKLAKILNPSILALHDVIDGNSASHHTWGFPLARHKSSFFSIDDELLAVKNYLSEVTKLLPKTDKYIIDSNHHHHILGYIERGRYLHEKQNYETGHRMVVEIIDGIDPFVKRVDPENNYTWTT